MLPLPALGAVAAFATLGAAVALLGFGRAGYMRSGVTVVRISLDGGGGLQVTAVEDQGAQSPPGSPPGSTQQWRVLRFEPCLDYIQAVTKVCVAPEGSPGPTVRLLSQALSLPYNKSLVAVTLASLAAIGAPVLEAARSGAASAPPLMRVLCLGLGGGSVPSFIAGALPGCQVDVAELEPAVVKAASEAMGFSEGPRLRVAVEGGGEFALRAAMDDTSGGAYDAVVIDCYDAVGNVPEELYCQGGDIARALACGLLREPGLLSANFLPRTDLTPRFGTYREALRANGATPGVSFSVEAEEGNLMTVQTCGGRADLSAAEWLDSVARAAREVGDAVRCPFDMQELATRELRVW